MHKDRNVWIADSGTSIHITSRRDFFKELKPSNFIRFVKIADDTILSATGIGTIDIQATVNGKKFDRQLTNVLLVPDLKRNLFSVGAVNDKKFSFHAYEKHCEVRDENGALSATGVRNGNLFHMLFEVKLAVDCNVAQVNSLKLWHERLGHINVKSIKDTEKTVLL